MIDRRIPLDDESGFDDDDAPTFAPFRRKDRPDRRADAFPAKRRDTKPERRDDRRRDKRAT